MVRATSGAPRAGAPLEPTPPQDITPGVRQLVAWLRKNGFDTCDSGDGKANVEVGMEHARDYPHVTIFVPVPEDMLSEARRLRDMLRRHGIDLRAQSMGRTPAIQATYDPCAKHALIDLMHVDDYTMDTSRR